MLYRSEVVDIITASLKTTKNEILEDIYNSLTSPRIKYIEDDLFRENA